MCSPCAGQPQERAVNWLSVVHADDSSVELTALVTAVQWCEITGSSRAETLKVGLNTKYK